jgi:hypothetical protein
MNQEQINELRKLAQAATPGPWAAGGPSFGAPMPVWCDEVVTEYGGDSPESVCLCPSGAEETSTDDMSYIAAANPAAILALIQQRDDLLAALKDARELVDDWGAYAPAYMQEKHDLAGDLDRLYSAIAKAEAQS